MFNRIVAITMVIFSLSGCASTYYSNHKPNEFTKVLNPKSFEIKHRVISQRKADSFGDVDSTQGILPGVYISALENSNGTLFFGNGQSYFVKYSNKDDYYVRVGGYWLPKNKGADTRLFYIVDSSKILVVKSIEEAEKRKAVASTSQNEGMLHLTPPATLAEGIGNALGWAIVNNLIESEEGNIVLVPTEAGFSERLSAELQPIRAPNDGAGHMR